MEDLNSVVRLWHIAPDGKRRLFNTISSSSQFFGFRTPNNMHLLENRIKCAEILRDGWVQCNQYPGKWEIETGKPDQVVLSKMTSDIIAKSRENIGVF